MTDATSASPSTSTALDLSRELAAAVKAAGTSVVGVEARRRVASSGILWRAAAPAAGPASSPPSPSSRATVVVTADHTVEREEDIAVILPDGRRGPPVPAGRDPPPAIAAPPGA